MAIDWRQPDHLSTAAVTSETIGSDSRAIDRNITSCTVRERHVFLALASHCASAT